LLPRVEALIGASAPIAVEAAATLAELGAAAQRTRGLGALRSMLGDASWPDVQVPAAAYLARASDAAAVPVLRAALRSPDEAMRLQATVSISAFAGFDGSPVDGAVFTRLAELDAVLADPQSSSLVRREAVYQVARIPPSAERQALLARVVARDPDAEVRRAAELRVDRP
jgi:hypothetical protein